MVRRTDPKLPLKDDFEFHIKLTVNMIFNQPYLEALLRDQRMKLVQRIDRDAEAWANKVVPPER